MLWRMRADASHGRGEKIVSSNSQRQTDPMPWKIALCRRLIGPPPFRRALLLLLEPPDHRSSLNGPSDATASSSPPPRPASAVLLWLGRAGLHLPGGIRAPGTGGGG